MFIHNSRFLHAVLGMLGLAVGLLFYIAVRDFNFWAWAPFSLSGFYPLDAASLWQSTPSLVFTLAVPLLAQAISVQRAFYWPLLFLMLAIADELLRPLITLNFISAPDLLAATLGACVAYAVLRLSASAKIASFHINLPQIAATLLGMSLIAACVEGYDCSAEPDSCSGPYEPYPEYEYEPIVMSYADLRAAVKQQDPQPIQQVGKVYLYKEYMLISDRNLGLHIIDNSDPAQPVKLSFIVIPGVLDIAVHDDILYADSYIDLVKIDLSDIENIRELERKEEVFRWDAYQNYTPVDYRNPRPLGYDIDSYRSEGIITGFDVTEIVPEVEVGDEQDAAAPDTATDEKPNQGQQP